jgi:uncharacterized RDD family membrane protein YckC
LELSCEFSDIQNAEGDGMKFAGFWVRFVAFLIDTFVLLIIVKLPISLAFGQNTAANLVISVIDALYFAIFESSSQQATPGKLALGLRVVDDEGNRISFIRALGRYLCKIVSGIILCIGFFMAGWTKEKTALHDLMVSTRVIKA